MIGRGTQRGPEVFSSNTLRGWHWGPGDQVQRWGENVVTAIKQRPPGGEMLYALFDKAGLPNESHLSNGDSGGAVFLDDGGVWKLGGINYDVDGAFYIGQMASGGFLAALFDQRGFYDENRHFVSGSAPVPSGFYASRISSRVEWIDSVVEPRLVNISTRATVGTGDQVSIAGFIVVGNPGQSRRVVVRGLGSSLKAGGVPVPGRLANPLIELHNAAGATMAVNDDWRTGSQSAEIQSRGLAPGNDSEAALIATLPVGAYTAVLRGANGSAGIGLVEVYDVGTYGNARLLNLSGRAFVRTGDNVLIGGLIVRSLSQRLLLRAIGPDLAAHGVIGALQNPCWSCTIRTVRFSPVTITGKVLPTVPRFLRPDLLPRFSRRGHSPHARSRPIHSHCSRSRRDHRRGVVGSISAGVAALVCRSVCAKVRTS